MWLHKLKTVICSLFYPPKCICCKKVLKSNEIFCDKCASELKVKPIIRDFDLFDGINLRAVSAFSYEDKVKEALDAGAAFAGSDEYIEKVKGGWLDFDVCVATPDMMKDVGRLGMVLGRKGLMPNPKTGTVTPNVGQAVAELKKGRTEYRADKTGIVHIAVGKCSMDADKVVANINTLLSEVSKKKPAGSAAGFIRSVSISSSMGPGVWVDYKEGE